MKQDIKIGELLFIFYASANNDNFTSPNTDSIENQLNVFPTPLTFNEEEIKGSFEFGKGEEVNIRINSQINVYGVVISNNSERDDFQQIIISTPQLRNAVLQITRTVQADSKVKYAAYVIDTAYVYDCQLTETSAYQCSHTKNKYVLRDIMQLCNN